MTAQIVRATGGVSVYRGGIVAIRAVDYANPDRVFSSDLSDTLSCSGSHLVEDQLVTASTYPPVHAYDRYSAAADTLRIDLAAITRPSWLAGDTTSVYMFASARVVGTPDSSYRRYETYRRSDPFAVCVGSDGWSAATDLSLSGHPKMLANDIPAGPATQMGYQGLGSWRLPNYQMVFLGVIQPGNHTSPYWSAQIRLRAYMIGAPACEIWLDQIVFIPLFHGGVTDGVPNQQGFPGSAYYFDATSNYPINDIRPEPSEADARFSRDYSARERQHAADSGDSIESSEQNRFPDMSTPPAPIADTFWDVAVPAGTRYIDAHTVRNDDFARTVANGWGTNGDGYVYQHRLFTVFTASWLSVNGSQAVYDFTGSGLGRRMTSTVGGPAISTAAGAVQNLTDIWDATIEAVVSADRSYTAHAGDSHGWVGMAVFDERNFAQAYGDEYGAGVKLHWDGTHVKAVLSFVFWEATGGPGANRGYPQAGSTVTPAQHDYGTAAIDVTTSPTTKIRVKFRNVGYYTMGKAWEDGTTEPDWQLFGWIPGGLQAIPDVTATRTWLDHPYTDVAGKRGAPFALWPTWLWLPTVAAWGGAGYNFKTLWDFINVSFDPGDGTPTDTHVQIRDNVTAAVLADDIIVPYGAWYFIALDTRTYMPDNTHGIDICRWVEDAAPDLQYALWDEFQAPSANALNLTEFWRVGTAGGPVSFSQLRSAKERGRIRVR